MSKSESSVKRCILLSFIFLVVIGIVASLCDFFISPNRAGALQSVRCSSAQDDSVPETWANLSDLQPVRSRPGQSYLFLRGTVPAGFSGTLYIKNFESFDGGVYVALDEQEIYENAEKGFFGNKITTLEIPYDEDSRELFVRIYNQPCVCATLYLSETADPLCAASRIPYFELIFSLILILVGIVMLLSLAVKRRRKVKWSVYALCTAPVLLGGAMFSEQLFQINGSANTFLFDFKIAVIALIVWGLIQHFLSGYITWNSGAEILMTLNLLCVACIWFLHYDLFMTQLIYICLSLQFVNCVYVILQFVRKKIPVNSINCSAMFLLLFADILFWLWFALLCSERFLIFICLCFTVCILLEWRKNMREPDILPAGDPVAESDSEPSGLQYSDVYAHLICRFPAYETVVCKCDGKEHHLLHVAEYSRIICLKMGMSEEKSLQISDAALLHDIGKLCVSAELLRKTDKLTDEEFEQVKNHSLYGYRILSGQGDAFFDLAAQIAYEHHERIDGSGYLGLKGTEISLPARIVSVADVFDALTASRSYKTAWSFDQAYAYILEHSGIYFDAKVVDAFSRGREQLEAVYRIYLSQSEGE